MMALPSRYLYATNPCLRQGLELGSSPCQEDCVNLLAIFDFRVNEVEILSARAVISTTSNGASLWLLLGVMAKELDYADFTQKYDREVFTLFHKIGAGD